MAIVCGHGMTFRVMQLEYHIPASCSHGVGYPLTGNECSVLTTPNHEDNSRKFTHLGQISQLCHSTKYSMCAISPVIHTLLEFSRSYTKMDGVDYSIVSGQNRSFSCLPCDTSVKLGELYWNNNRSRRFGLLRWNSWKKEQGFERYNSRSEFEIMIQVKRQHCWT